MAFFNVPYTNLIRFKSNKLESHPFIVTNFKYSNSARVIAAI